MSDEPIPAATLVVVRENVGATPELLMVERAAGMAFAGGALVFPGGRIDDGDRLLADGLGLADGAAKIAAIRETIEETAIPVGIAPVPSPSSAAALQEALIADRPFADVLVESGLHLDPAGLTPFARWLPNFHVTRRFDTLFFLARAPAGDWEPKVIEGECTGAFWLSAAEALDREQRGDAQLMFPTRRNLERLAQHRNFAEMASDASRHAVDPITPWVEEMGGEKFVTIPEGLGYPTTREKLDGLWRG
jgi:8-oxo-dGTP pyrophosphatase MutT (NUDIX family)